MATEYGLAGLAFADEGQEPAALADMMRRWPRAEYVEDAPRPRRSPAASSTRDKWRPDTPLRVVLIGTDFEIRVWETLLKVPVGCATTYSDVARRIERPSAARAVGAAVGKNPISFVVPCHRVLGRSGQPHRLPLGPDAQARHPRLGGGRDGGDGLTLSGGRTRRPPSLMAASPRCSARRCGNKARLSA